MLNYIPLNKKNVNVSLMPGLCFLDCFLDIVNSPCICYKIVPIPAKAYFHMVNFLKTTNK